MKNGEQILEAIGMLRVEMCELLVENRAANEASGLPLVGPAAKKIGVALDGLKEAYLQIVESTQAPSPDSGKNT